MVSDEDLFLHNTVLGFCLRPFLERIIFKHLLQQTSDKTQTVQTKTSFHTKRCRPTKIFIFEHETEHYRQISNPKEKRDDGLYK